MKRYSILHSMEYCYICGKKKECIHEVYEGRNRQNSIKNGFCIGLCNEHHNMSNYSVHFNKDLQLKVKRDMQKKYEETHTREEFMNIIGRNYLD